MNKIINGVLIVAGLFFGNAAYAQVDTVVGVWTGELNVAAGNELTLQFDIKGSENAYSVLVNSPQNEAIKNLNAGKVIYNDSKLTFELADLNGRFEGSLDSGAINGFWFQLDEKYPLRLTPLAQHISSKKGPSKELVQTLLGSWHSMATFSTASMNALFYFKLDDAGELCAIAEFPDNGSHYVVPKNFIVDGNNIRVNLWEVDQYFEGKLDGDVLKGIWWFKKMPFKVNFEKKEWNPDYFSFELKKSEKEALLGSWYADVPVQGEGVTLKMNFDETSTGKVRGYLDSYDDGWYGVRMDTLNVSDGTKITFSHKRAKIKFDGVLTKDNTITGVYKGGDLVSPNIVFKKGDIAPVVLEFPESVSKELVGLWSGVIKGQEFRLRFEREQNGVVGFIDSINDGQSAVRVRFGTYKKDTITLKTAGMTTEYEAKLVDGALVGKLKSGAEQFELMLIKTH